MGFDGALNTVGAVKSNIMKSPHQLVPEFIYEKYRAGTAYGSFQGAAMFVDLSGFSTMADVLATRGPHGAEVLANMMRVVFEPLVNAVYEQGGFVIGYAGDAFNAIFPINHDATQTMRRCLSSALTMQTHTKTHSRVSTPYGEFTIRIKVGIGFGATTWQIFKSINGKRASYWFRGESLNGAVSGEEHAQAGEVVADSISYNLLMDIATAEPVGNFFLIQNTLADLPKPQPLSPPKPVDDLVDIFFADDITRLPIAGEFRQAVNLFIDIPASISDEALIAPFMETVYLLQEQYGGFFLRPDLGDKGFNLLMFWGAPTAHENDVERALNFILELSHRTRITLRAGISYRMAYAGFIGSSQREDYTAYGWGVNLAARMMARAGSGEYWMDEEVSRRAAKHFNLEVLGEHQFKGFKNELKVFTLVGRKNLVETVYQGQLVGRNKELEALASFIQPLKQRHFAGVMVLKGEAGIGKSRLVHAFQYSDNFDDFPTQWMVCQADEILRLPFNPFVDWLKKRFELLEGQPDEVNLITFLRNIQELSDSVSDPELAAELIRTSSVLAALINITRPDSLYEKLDAKGRYENTLVALSVLLRAESLQKPLILFMEDTHWLDKDTGSFLSYFVRTLLAEPEKQYPIAIIATQRPEGDTLWAANEVSAQEIGLDKLTSKNLSQLAADVLFHPIADSLLTLLDARADGNPFFAEQILRYLSEQNALALDADGKYFANAQAETSLPTDVRAVLIARLDRLTHQVKEVVQTASVLGREFEVRVLGEMLRADRNFSIHMAQAENADIWTALTEIEYIFRHALLRDAAYSMQLQARQRELHRLAAAAMETVYRNDLEPHFGELAYHAEKAGFQKKALRYLNLAGKLSMGAYQNQQAVDYFTRALACVPADDLRARFELLILRAESYYNLSNHQEQARDLSMLEELANQLKDKGLLARAFMRHAYHFSALGEFQKVLDYALPAKDFTTRERDTEVILVLYTLIPGAFLRLGKMSDALRYAKDGLAFAQSVNHRRGEGNALTFLGLVSLEKEGAAIAIGYHEQALMIARELEDKYLEGMALSNLASAMVASQADYSIALGYLEQAYSIACELGSGSGQAVTVSNLGWLAGILGNYPAAINYFKQALTLARKIGGRSQQINIYINLSAVAGAQGNIQDALKWGQEALDLSVKLGDPTGSAWAYFYLGYAHLLSEKLEEAKLSFLQSIEIRLEISPPVLTAEARAGLLDAYSQMGDLDSTRTEVGLILEYMDKNKTFEGAEEPQRIFLSVYQTLQKIKDPRASIVLQNAIQLLDAQVSKLRSEEARHMYINNVPWRRSIYQTAKENGLTG